MLKGDPSGYSVVLLRAFNPHMGSNPGGAGDLEGCDWKEWPACSEPEWVPAGKAKAARAVVEANTQVLEEEVSEATEKDFQTSSPWKLSG